MKRFLLQVEQVLRGGPSPTAGILPRVSLTQLLLFVCICGFCYGAVMGSFGGVTGVRLVQAAYSATKVPLLLLASFLLALPSFFVLNTLLGVRGDFPDVVRALIASQAGLAIVLLSLAPYTLFWYASSADYPLALLCNGLMFAVASFTAQAQLRRYYRPLIERNRRHRWLMRFWVVIYVFVGSQMGWVLRPFIGAPDLPTQFFRAESWGNVYVVLAQLIVSLFR